jgi:hypothetical protein
MFFLNLCTEGHLLTVTIPDAVLIQFDLLRMSKVLLETYRAVVLNLCETAAR